MERMRTVIFLEILENGVPIFCVRGDPSAGMVLSVVDSVIKSKQYEELINSGKNIQEWIDSKYRNKYEWRYHAVNYISKMYNSSGEDIDGFLYDKPSGSGKHRRGIK